MKFKLFLAGFIIAFGIQAQNLHDDANAVSILNEANTTTGWREYSATVTSDNTDSQSGIYSFRIVADDGNSDSGRYKFPVVAGTTYNISIWAKRGAQGTSQRFKNWTGFANFVPQFITSTTWTEYTFNLTASITGLAQIRCYSADNNGGFAGDELFIDSVTIVEASSDTEAPSAVTTVAASNTTSTSTDLSWTASTDNVAVINYEVFQNGSPIGFTGGATTFNVTGLAPNSNFNFTVFARDAAGNISLPGNTENVTTLPDTESPSAVTSLVASNITPNTTDLNWNASTDNIGVTDYEVFQDAVSIGFTGGATSFNVSGLSPLTSYDFTILARDAIPNISSAGNTVNITTSAAPDGEAPTAVTSLAASNTTTTTTDLSWTASIDNVGVTDYEVFQDAVSLGFTGGATSFNVSGLSPLTNYDFTVFARDAALNISAAGNTASITTLADTEAPTAVLTLAASNTTAITTDLSWTASTDNIAVTDYEVFQDAVSIGFTGGATNFNVTSLTGSTSYAFTVLARDAVPNISATGNTVNITTSVAPDTEAPSAVTTVAASNTTMTSTDLSWTASTDNVGVTDYEVFQDGLSIGLTSGLTTFNVAGLASGTSFAFTVFARDLAGNVSLPGNTANVTTLTDIEAPSAVITLAASNTTSTSTDLSWTASTDNVAVTDYEVFQDAVSIGFTGGATNFNVTGLSALISYDFTVLARDEIPNISAAGNIVNVTTLSATDYTSANSNLPTVDWQARDLFADRNIGIGTTDTQGYRLAVAGNVVAEEIKVALQINWPDFVFEKNYQLPTLEEVEAYIKQFGHLINIPSAAEVSKSGILLGQMNAKLLEKIEELTLYTIEQEKKLQRDQVVIEQLVERIEAIEASINNKKLKD